MQKLYLLVLILSTVSHLRSQGTNFSWITDVQKTDDGGVVLQVSLYDEVGVAYQNQEAPLAQSYVFAKNRLPKDAEISIRRFSTYSPYVVEIDDKHVYFVAVYYDNKTPDPKDDLHLGSASFEVDKQKSETMISAMLLKYEGLRFAVHQLLGAPLGKPAFETDTTGEREKD